MTKTSLLERFVNMYGRLPTEVDPDYLELLNMTKYRILDIPDFKPGKCANCGASKNDGRKYIDFQLEIDWYGIVYLCGTCMKDTANALGLFDDIRHDLDVTRQELLKALENNERIDSLNATVVKTADELKELYGELSSRQHSIESYSGDRTDVKPDAPAEVEQPIMEAKRTTIKPNSGRGPKDVPSLASLLNKS